MPNLMVFVDENTEPSVGALHDSCNTPVQNLSVVHLPLCFGISSRIAVRK